MNYIVEQIEFRKYAYNNFLSTNAMMLWHELFNLCNEFGWIKWFTTNDERLRQYTAIKRAASLTAARNELIEHGLIEYRKGAKGYSSEYHMVSYEVYANGSVSDEALSVDEDLPVKEEIHDTGNISIFSSQNLNQYITDETPFDTHTYGVSKWHHYNGQKCW